MGNASATVSVLPIPNNIAQGDRTAVFNLTSDPAYNPGSAMSGLVTIHDKPADGWRFENFGANANEPAAADSADWDRDGISNLLEFALGFDPKVPNANALPVAVKAGGYLTISYLPNASATDVNIVVEASTDLVRWSGADVEQLNVVPPTYRYDIPLTQADRAFLRLRVFRTDL